MTQHLFVCSAGRLRSPTAAKLWIDHGHCADYAGIYGERRLTPEAITTASYIYCMEAHHLRCVLDVVAESLSAKAIGGKTFVVLGIEDRYQRNDPALIELLTPWLPKGNPWPPELGKPERL